MKALVASLLVAFAANLMAQEPKPLGSVQEGVYFMRTGTRTNILELKNGHFRLWNSSTLNIGGLRNNPDVKPAPRFNSSLRSGEYTTNGGTVKFVLNTESPRHPIVTNEFTFMEFEGKVTLWTPSAQKYWTQNKVLYPPGILEATDRKPEEILEGK